MGNNSIYTPEMQNKIKRLVGLGWMTRGKLDSFSTIKYLLMDIYRQNKQTGIHFWAMISRKMHLSLFQVQPIEPVPPVACITWICLRKEQR